MALGNHVIKETGLVETINATVRWDPKQWEANPGQLAKMMILARPDEYPGAADSYQQTIYRLGHGISVWQRHYPACKSMNTISGSCWTG